MPPVMMTGVSASASSPSSTLSRVISKKLPSVAKFGAIDGEERDLGRERQQQHPLAVGEARVVAVPRSGSRRRDRRGMALRPRAQRVDRDRGEDDGALDRALPVRAHAEERQRRADRAEQDDAEQRAGELPRPPVIAVPPTTTAAITFSSSPRPALLGIWLKRTEFSSAASPVSAPGTTKTPP